MSRTTSPEAVSAPPILLSVEETAHVLAVGRSTVYELLAAGSLPSLTLGRRRLIRVVDVHAFAARLVAEAAQ